MDIYPENYHEQFPVSRRKAIHAIFEALEVDYGSRFISNFKGKDGSVDAKQVTQWKSRLADFSRPYSDEQLLNAVDDCCRRSRDFPPTLREIQDAMREAESIRRERERQAERVKRESLPDNPVNKEKIKTLREEAAVRSSAISKPQTPEDELRLLLEKREQYFVHESMILAHSADKSFPMTRRLDDRIKWLTQQIQESRQCA